MNDCIKVISSGSSGNSLVIYDSRGKYIIVDVGLPYNQIISSLNYDLTNCVSIFCTHDHFSDHTKSLDKFIK